MSEQLKPCPFCGSVMPHVEPEYEYDPDGGWSSARVKCWDCDTDGPVGESYECLGEAKDEDVRLWNKRTDEAMKEMKAKEACE